jgi:hypothetical protein
VELREEQPTTDSTEATGITTNNVRQLPANFPGKRYKHLPSLKSIESKLIFTHYSKCII